MIPASRAEVKGLRSWLLWALAGNDEDTIYGDDAWRAGRAKNSKTARSWWARNPLHNLFWHVLVWPRASARALVTWQKGEWPSFWYEDNSPSIWLPDLKRGQLKIYLAPAFISLRWLFGYEFYLGFRTPGGRPGAAIRKIKP